MDGQGRETSDFEDEMNKTNKWNNNNKKKKEKKKQQQQYKPRHWGSTLHSISIFELKQAPKVCLDSSRQV